MDPERSVSICQQRTIKRKLIILTTLVGLVIGMHLMRKVNVAREPGHDSEKMIGLHNSNIADQPRIRNERYQRIMTNACSKRNQTRFPYLLYKPPVQSNMLKVEHTHNLYYCPVQKVASSYWLRVLDTIGSKNKNNPYATSISNLQHLSFVQLWERNISGPRLLQLLSARFAFLFVRDPYVRLLSAYVDKIYFPNPVYWPSLTKEIARVVGRPNSTGHDITFAETVKYLIHMNKVQPDKIDMHFQTITRLCDPCGIYYDFVGKFETIKEDSHYLLQYLSENYQNVEFNFDESETANRYDDIRRHARALFKTMQTYKFPPVMSKYEIFTRAWRDLQIRGYLSKSYAMPISKTQAPGINEINFTNILKKAFNSSSYSDDIDNQHEEAFLQAYSTVPYGDLIKLQQMYSEDCKTFGYDCKPAKIFDRKPNVVSKSKFQYFKLP